LTKHSKRYPCPFFVENTSSVSENFQKSKHVPRAFGAVNLDFLSGHDLGTLVTAAYVSPMFRPKIGLELPIFTGDSAAAAAAAATGIDAQNAKRRARKTAERLFGSSKSSGSVRRVRRRRRSIEMYASFTYVRNDVVAIFTYSERKTYFLPTP